MQISWPASCWENIAKHKITAYNSLQAINIWAIQCIWPNKFYNGQTNLCNTPTGTSEASVNMISVEFIFHNFLIIDTPLSLPMHLYHHIISALAWLVSVTLWHNSFGFFDRWIRQWVDIWPGITTLLQNCSFPTIDSNSLFVHWNVPSSLLSSFLISSYTPLIFLVLYWQYLLCIPHAVPHDQEILPRLLEHQRQHLCWSQSWYSVSSLIHYKISQYTRNHPGSL